MTRRHPARAGRRPDRRSAPIEAGFHAGDRPRADGHGQDAALEPPEDFLRTLIEAEITSRDASNAQARLKAANFPVAKRLEDFDCTVSSIPPPLSTWPRSSGSAPARTRPGRPGRHRQESSPGGFESRPVDAGRRVRIFSAAELVDTLDRGLADNSVGRVIQTILRGDYVILDDLGFASLDHIGAQLLFRFVAAAYERRSLGVASHSPFEEGGRFLPEHTTARSMLDRLLYHAQVVVTQGDSYRMREARQREGPRR